MLTYTVKTSAEGDSVQYQLHYDDSFFIVLDYLDEGWDTHMTINEALAELEVDVGHHFEQTKDSDDDFPITGTAYSLEEWYVLSTLILAALEFGARIRYPLGSSKAGTVKWLRAVRALAACGVEVQQAA